jgi:transcriptional regulator with XRE-family HTH domain
MTKKLSVESARSSLAHARSSGEPKMAIDAVLSGSNSGGFPIGSENATVLGGQAGQLSLFQSTPSPLPLSAYLACALTGLKEDQRNYLFKISDVISESCEKVGIELYQPRHSTDPIKHSDVTPSQVYDNDKKEVVLKSDLLIHLADHPSTGVGEELELARAALLPMLLIYPAHVKVSRMVLGIPSLMVHIAYKTIDDLQSQLANCLFDLRPILEERKLAFANYRINVVGQKILEARHGAELTREEVAAASNKIFTEGRLAGIEEQTDLESNPSLVELRVIATILKTTVSELVEPNLAQQVFVQLKAWTEGREAARTFISKDDQTRLVKAMLYRMADKL